MTIHQYNQSVDLYSDSLYRFILKNIKDTDKANDIVQDSYEKLWLKVETVSFEKVKSYLFTIGYHTLIDHIRFEKKTTNYDEIKVETFTQTEQFTDLNEILHKAVSLLPDIQRTVILLRDYEGYSYDEIGEITGLNSSQIKVYIFRARAFLRNYIGSIEAII